MKEVGLLWPILTEPSSPQWEGLEGGRSRWALAQLPHQGLQSRPCPASPVEPRARSLAALRCPLAVALWPFLFGTRPEQQQPELGNGVGG